MTDRGQTREPWFQAPVPNFEKCGNCGADASQFCTWDTADGWCCSKCGGCDSDE